MKKYLSCIILIVICIVCATVFYVNANEFLPNDTASNDSSIISNTTNSTLSSDTQTGGLIPDEMANHTDISISDRQDTGTTEWSGRYLVGIVTE